MILQTMVALAFWIYCTYRMDQMCGVEAAFKIFTHPSNKGRKNRANLVTKRGK